MTNFIIQVNNSTKIRFGEDHASTKITNEYRKNVARINSRDQVKIEVKDKEIHVIKTPQ